MENYNYKWYNEIQDNYIKYATVKIRIAINFSKLQKKNINGWQVVQNHTAKNEYVNCSNLLISDPK